MPNFYDDTEYFMLKLTQGSITVELPILRFC